ncbi:DUF2061 domain-containing protein [Aquimarina aquimarini]|uniref:DUF2061 domain-containing protein n=1 Tax=Aquimarina aquimarini TaxID=1191734 RepID=UPI000D55E137|nr:DUF2061 domain-containing protein [Aquimarina aquimarini]
MVLYKLASKKTTYEDDRGSEKPIRSIAKAISWRVVGTVDTLIVSYVLTNKIAVATSIASIDFITKMILYFFHERIWNSIKWAR